MVWDYMGIGFGGLGRRMYCEAPGLTVEDPIEKSLAEKDTLVFEITSSSKVLKEPRSVFSWFGKYSDPEKALSRREVLENASKVLNSGSQLAVYLNGQEITAYTKRLLEDMRTGCFSLEDLPSVKEDMTLVDPRRPKHH